LFFHPDHGYLKVTQVKHENDEENLPVVSVLCNKLDSKGKKTEEEVEMDKKKIRQVKNRFEV
jgi:hypothetical protein